MGGSLFGSAPKATFSTQPTILPQQQDLLNMLTELFKTGGQPAGVVPYTGTYSAPLQPIQNTSLAALEQQAINATAPQDIQKTPQQTAALDQSFNTLNEALNYQAPTIDSTAAFQQGVVAPLTENFTSNVLPALDARYAGSAGGAYGSGRQQSNLQAAQEFDTTLSQQGSKFAYDTAAANQAAELQANQQRLAALGVAPTIAGAPSALDATIGGANLGLQGGFIQNLMNILNAGSVPYNQAQTQVAGEYGEFTRQQQQAQQLINAILAAAGMPTIQTSGVGSAGSSGILPSLFSTAGTLGAAAITSSDVRLKDNLEPIGDVDGIPLYRFRYKGDATPRIGFMAQDVERRVPEAVITLPSGYKGVDYAAVFESVLEAA